MVPRPDPDEETAALATEILERANEELLPEYADHDHEGIGSALVEAAAEADGVDLDRDEAAPDGAASAGGLDDALDLDPTAADGGTGADDEGVDDDPFAGAFAEANEDPDVLGSDDGDDDLDDWGFGEVSGGGGGGGG
jgi:flagellar protein FlaI